MGSRSQCVFGLRDKIRGINARRDWVRLGAVELGSDCLRRYLQRLLVTERADFERV